MPIDPDYLQLLVSPGDTPAQRRPLREATTAEVQALNAAIHSGAVRSRGGGAVTSPVTAGLIPIGEAVLYPIVDGIPILLAEEAIPMPADFPTAAGAATAGDPTRPMVR